MPVDLKAPAVWWKRPRAQAGLATATLALLAFSAVMLGTVHGLQRRLAGIPGDPPPVTAPATVADLIRIQADLTREQARAADLERRLAEAAARLAERDVARGLQATLVLPGTAKPLPIYAAALRHADGRVVWTSSATGAGDRTITVTIPAGRLTRGDFQLILRGGATATAALDDLATCDLRIGG